MREFLLMKNNTDIFMRPAIISAGRSFPADELPPVSAVVATSLA